MKERSHEERVHVATGPYCNNYCIFCCEDFLERRPPSTENVKNNLLKNKSIGKVLFTSKEPTLNPNIFEWIKIAKEIGYTEIGIITNGRMLAYKDFCEKLFEGGLNKVIVSIHGPNARIHNAHTRDPNSFEQTQKGLLNLSEFKKKINFVFEINYTITKMNYNHIDDFLDIINPLKPDTIHFNLVEPIGRTLKHFNVIVPRYSEVVKHFANVMERKELLQQPKNMHPKISITAPFCLLEQRFWIFVSNFEQVIREKREDQLPRENRIKGKKCKECAYFNACEGVNKDYIKVYGWYEFNPI